MFDELDDPAPPSPGPSVRQAVGARAAKLRRNRRLAGAGGAASGALVAIALVAGLSGSPRSVSRIEPLASETPSPTGEPTPEPSSPGPGEPTATPPAESPSPAPPTPEPPTSPPAEPALAGCTTATALPSGDRKPGHGLTLTLVADGEFDRSEDGTATLVITNTTNSYGWEFDLRAYRANGSLQTVARGTGGRLSGVSWNDAIRQYRVVVGPGEEWRQQVDVPTDDCGTPLPAGRYDLAAGVQWSNVVSWHGDPPVTPGPGDVSVAPPGTSSPSPSPTGAPTPLPSSQPSPGEWVPWATEPVSVTFR